MPKIAYTDEVENCGVSFIYDTEDHESAGVVLGRLANWLDTQVEISQVNEESWRDPAGAIYATPPVDIPAADPPATTKTKRKRRTKEEMAAERASIAAGGDPEPPAALALIGETAAAAEAPSVEELKAAVVASLGNGKLSGDSLTEFLRAISPTMQVVSLAPADRQRLYAKLLESPDDAG